MAESKVGIVIEAQDKATSTLKNVGGSLDRFKGKVEAMRPAFKTMAVAGTAAFGALATGIGFSVKEAAMAEGAYNKFNSVFKDGADDMLDFVNELRREMPTATHEIVRLAADMQDLLVPMGLSRELSQDMTQGFLTLSNQLAAFNDVDPTQVLEAMKSALVGSSEPLRQFGIDARITTLEATALKEGLIKAGEKFSDLTPEVRSQVTAQALLKQAIGQSSDAIEGFGVNQDSFLRRWQDIQATMTEVRKEIGDAFLPILDELLKVVLPVVKELTTWAKENPTLVKQIGIAALAVSGLLAVVGFLGLVLPSIIAGFTMLGTALIFLATNPIAWFVYAIVGISIAIKELIEYIYDVELTWKEIFMSMGEIVSTYVVEPVKELYGWLKDISEILTSGGGLSGFFKNVAGGAKELLKSAGEIIGVDDAIITPQGQVIKTAPDDYIIATKEPIGGGMTFNFDFRGATVADKESFIKDIKTSLTRSLQLREQGI